MHKISLQISKNRLKILVPILKFHIPKRYFPLNLIPQLPQQQFNLIFLITSPKILFIIENLHQLYIT